MECLLQLQFRWLTAPIASICARAICRPALGLFQVEHPGPSRVARGNKDHSVMCQLRDCCQPAAQILKLFLGRLLECLWTRTAQLVSLPTLEFATTRPCCQ